MKSENKLRIAMVTPVFGTTGGPEIVAANLVDSLLEKGVDVTIFAPGDWKTKAKHVVTIPQSLREMKDYYEQTSRTRINFVLASLVKVLFYQNDFDIVHLHSQRWSFPISFNLNVPCVITCHSLIDKQDFEFASKYSHIVSISQYQKGDLETSATIWNGVPVKNVEASFEKGRYLIAIGRISEQKGIHNAIAIAKKAGKKLLIFGRIGATEEKKKYYQEKILPHLDGKNIILMKEVPNNEIYEYLRNAEALLFPITKPEVFGLVVAEALACGTPVIGTCIDPVPELLQNPKTAFLSNDIDQLAEAAKNIDTLFDRRECRKYAETHFDKSIMAEKYIELYKKILGIK